MVLNRQQFEPHGFMDPQPEGLHVGHHLLRSARVYAADLDDPHNADDPNSTEPGAGQPNNHSSFMALVPLENGGHAQLHWNEHRAGAPQREKPWTNVHVSSWNDSLVHSSGVYDNAADVHAHLLRMSEQRVEHKRGASPEQEQPWITETYDRYR